jgi:protein LSM12
VLIQQPYTVENLSAPKDKQQSLPYIRKVLEGYWQKKRPVNRAPVATPIAPRKGG